MVKKQKIYEVPILVITNLGLGDVITMSNNGLEYGNDFEHWDDDFGNW